MKKILAALLLLALVAPAMADVTITGTDADNEQLLISFATTGLSEVRGIALTLTVTGGSVLNAASFMESDFNTFIDYAFSTPGYTIDSGHPLALETAAGIATFPIPAGTPFAVSVGYLDQASGQAGLFSGTVIKLQLDIPDGTTASVAISANATRGGAVVGDDLGVVSIATATVPVVGDVADWIIGPAVVTKTTAAPAIGTRVNSGRVETFAVSGVTGSSAIEYQFTFGDSTTSAWSTSTTATKTYTYGGAGVVSLTGYNYNVTVQARLVSNPAISITSAALALASEAVKSTAGTIYTDWGTYGRPVCWAYPRNCKGDVNGVKQGSAVLGYIGYQPMT